MAKKRTTRQKLIDLCRSNESQCLEIRNRLEAILGTYFEDSPENSLTTRTVLESCIMFQDVLEKFTTIVKGA